MKISILQTAQTQCRYVTFGQNSNNQDDSINQSVAPQTDSMFKHKFASIAIPTIMSLFLAGGALFAQKPNIPRGIMPDRPQPMPKKKLETSEFQFFPSYSEKDLTFMGGLFKVEIKIIDPEKSKHYQDLYGGMNSFPLTPPEYEIFTQTIQNRFDKLMKVATKDFQKAKKAFENYQKALAQNDITRLANHKTVLTRIGSQLDNTLVKGFKTKDNKQLPPLKEDLDRLLKPFGLQVKEIKPYSPVDSVLGYWHKN